MSEQTTYIVVTDTGFSGIQTNSGAVLKLLNTANALESANLFASVERIDVEFPSFADGRGFSLALNLRRHGYQGHIRAVGHIIADQYAHARRCGFDDVAISQADADRQSEKHWLEQVPHINTTYQTRLHQAAVVA